MHYILIILSFGFFSGSAGAGDLTGKEVNFSNIEFYTKAACDNALDEVSRIDKKPENGLRAGNQVNVEEAKMLGMGAMIHILGGGSENSGEKYYGRKITDAEFDDNALNLTFSDDVKIAITDEGQSCCENRYMKTDDDVKWLIGKTLKELTIKSAPEEPDEYGSHEVQFLEVMTNDGCITFANHNEHNGYYGGFGMNIKEVPLSRDTGHDADK